ncbi:TBC1 domain family member 20-like [Uloborus diversus]|uniref:TBC1 domain family member 20-like n=1 Tax=Uloborus diversus TaxID=327109 RepID=UPI0024094005|nr:TBC1 domain family member 20-like [Uloborus diversus]
MPYENALNFSPASKMSVKIVSDDLIFSKSCDEVTTVNSSSECSSDEVNCNIIKGNKSSSSLKGDFKNCCTDSVFSSEVYDNSSENISFNSELNSESNVDSAFEIVEESSQNLTDSCTVVASDKLDEHNESEGKTSLKHNSSFKKKRKKILSALADEDIIALRQAAISSGGLLTDEIRRKVWPKLVGVDVFETSPRPSREEIEEHPYYRQVVLDVNRSLKRFPPSIKEVQRLAMLDQLVLLIMRVLCRHPELHYYQGYHDICVTFLLVLGEETAYYVIEKLSRTHLRVFMEKTMEPTIELLSCMFPLIGKKSPKLAHFLQKSEVGVAYCLSWLITWFGHVLNDYNDVVRLFDFFIVSHSWMPMYLTSVVVLHQESEVLTLDCDMASVHSFLSKIPDDLPFEDLIPQALELHKAYAPEILSLECPLSKEKKLRPKRNGIMYSFSKTLKTSVPVPSFTVPLVIAAAVLVTAVLYQAYKY